MRTTLIIASLCSLLVACSPPCDPITITAQSVCHRADAGAIAVNAPFTVHATTNVSGAPTCFVDVDGGSIVLGFSLASSCGAGGSGAARPAPQPVACAIPALPAGAYSFNTVPPTSFSIPGADGGIADCP